MPKPEDVKRLYTIYARLIEVVQEEEDLTCGDVQFLISAFSSALLSMMNAPQGVVDEVCKAVQATTKMNRDTDPVSKAMH